MNFNEIFRENITFDNINPNQDGPFLGLFMNGGGKQKGPRP